MTVHTLESLLSEVLNTPTAPFAEARIAALVDRHASLADAGLCKDDFGNRVVIVRPKGKVKARLGFVAHMDHPGFSIVAAKGKKARALWTGGVWRSHFGSVPVIVQTAEGPVRGTVTKTTPPAPKKAKPGETKDEKKARLAANEASQKRVEFMDLALEAPVAAGDFGHWDLVPYALKDGLVHTRAADDLCSVAVQLALLHALKNVSHQTEVWLVFTRAEENGFTGALTMVEGTLPKSLPLISLETSKTLPGAVQGQGPVIRLGDKKSVFSSELILFMDACAASLKAQNPDFNAQRRIMDGGTCEATAFIASGYQAAGLAFPLGNYHNMSDTKPDTLEAETVQLADMENGLTLLVEMCVKAPLLDGTLDRLAETLAAYNTPYLSRLKENPV